MILNQIGRILAPVLTALMFRTKKYKKNKEALICGLLCLLISSAANSSSCYFKNLRGAPSELSEFKRCVIEASEIHSVSPTLLVALKRTETGLRVSPSAINRNTDGTVDYGVMQINYPTWAIEFKRIYNIELTVSDLLDLCSNVHVSAMILKQRLDKYGSVFESVGRYHSGTPKHKERYQEKFAEEARLIIGQCQD